MAPRSSSELSRCITTDDWINVENIATDHPAQARQSSQRHGFFEGLRDSTCLPLHECLVAATAPLAATAAVLAAYPDAVHCTESSYLRLPLHCACRRHADPAVVALLLDYHDGACLIPDQLGRLPLHYALSNGAEPSVVQLLLQRRPEAARGVDARGWTPLHVAASMGADSTIVQALLAAHPAAVVLRTKKGSSVLKCLHKQCPNRQQLKELLLAARQEFDANFRSPLLQRMPSTDSLELC
jgi:hypothetical protein